MKNNSSDGQQMANAKKEYQSANKSTKDLLERIFGQEAFAFDCRSITTPELAFAANGTTGDEVYPYKDPKTPKQHWLNAISAMDEIYRAINPGFLERIDWSNSSQYKWRGWFKYDSSISGFRFIGSRYDRVSTISTGGSRLCAEDSEKDEFIAKTFIDIWNIILLK